MAVLADDKPDIAIRQGAMGRTRKVTFKTGDTYYNGAIICYESGGSDCVVGTDGSGLRIAGVYHGETFTTTADTVGEVRTDHVEWFRQDGNITAAMVGTCALILDDQTVTNATTAAQDIELGEILELETRYGNAGCWIHVGRTDSIANAP